MPFFYIFAALFWLVAFFGDGPEHAVLLATITLLVFAVIALDQRIRMIAKKIENTDLDVDAHIRQEWWDLAKWFASLIGLILMGTFVLGFISCASSGEEVTLSCLFTHMLEYWIK